MKTSYGEYYVDAGGRYVSKGEFLSEKVNERLHLDKLTGEADAYAYSLKGGIMKLKVKVSRESSGRPIRDIRLYKCDDIRDILTDLMRYFDMTSTLIGIFERSLCVENEDELLAALTLAENILPDRERMLFLCGEGVSSDQVVRVRFTEDYLASGETIAPIDEEVYSAFAYFIANFRTNGRLIPELRQNIKRFGLCPKALMLVADKYAPSKRVDESRLNKAAADAVFSQPSSVCALARNLLLVRNEYSIGDLELYLEKMQPSRQYVSVYLAMTALLLEDVRDKTLILVLMVVCGYLSAQELRELGEELPADGRTVNAAAQQLQSLYNIPAHKTKASVRLLSMHSLKMKNTFGKDKR